MDALMAYGSDEEAVLPPIADSAPPVSTTGLALVSAGGFAGQGVVVPVAATRNLHDPSKHMVYFNPRVEDLHAPVAGPAHPTRSIGLASGQRNHPTGSVEAAHLQTFTFEEQYNTFHALGYTVEPSGAGYVGDAAAAAAFQGKSLTELRATDRKRKGVDSLERALSVAGAEQEARPGIWAAPVQRGVKPMQSHEELTAEQKAYIEWHNARREARRKKPADEGAGAAEAEAEAEAEPVTGGEKTHFHGKAERDYLGNSWLVAPKDKKKQNETCFLPKRWVHTWPGHTKGVAAIRFFPNSGHLLLSAGMDSKMKIWDVYGSGKLMRTYMGHTAAVKDVCFSADGTRFVSCSYDKDIKLWDTETGKVLTAVTPGKVPHCVKLHPDADKQHVLLAGCADRKIVQWDLNSGDMTQEYEQHLAAVNTLTFVDEGRRFVSSSDDKTMRVWEFGIPVVIKLIADPSMHSMPSVALSPTGGWLAAQSLDNQVVIYSTKERFRLNAKKHFRGHTCAGYACQVSFSPDGRFLLSGDGDGRLFIWDWKTSRIARTLKCHDQVTIGCEWHPLEASKVATCSWDGAIKLWD